MSDQIYIGWAQRDITPKEPVLLSGQLYARVSEGIVDPLTVTALALESSNDHAVIVSCDLLNITDALPEEVRKLVTNCKGLDPQKVILHATHTHTAPVIPSNLTDRDSNRAYSPVELRAMAPEKYLLFAAGHIATAVTDAWSARRPGSLSFGLGQAVIGRNRRSVRSDGSSVMFASLTTPDFVHIEGYEDQNVGIIAAYDSDDNLSGVVLNVACPAQVIGNEFVVSADYWHDVRVALRLRLKEDLFVLGQCSAAGDICPQRMGKWSYTYDSRAEARMLELRNCNERQLIAARMARIVAEVLPVISPVRETDPVFRHTVATISLPTYQVTAADAEDARAKHEHFMQLYEEEKKRLEENPSLKNEPRWYVPVTKNWMLAQRHAKVLERYETQGSARTLPFEIHTLRIGDMAMATNPFEYYLDFGIQIKVRSPAVQTFLVQLAGAGTYVPSPRSVKGGGYGSEPASNLIGPEGGTILREATLNYLSDLWNHE